jgi:flagellar hook-associated protein 2
MGRISTGIGLISGINSRDIIEQLMSLEARPKQMIQTRIETVNLQRMAFTDLRTRLTGLRMTASALKRPSTFQEAATSSSNENVLTATAARGAAVGSYQFQVARLVSTHQTVSRGFTSPDARIGAGTLTIEMGGGELKSQTPLAQLNGGEGIRRGMFRITDRAGNTSVIDTTSAVTLDDVVRRINMALETNVRASVGGERLVLTDQSGGTGNLIVQDLGDGGSATDLGIVANVAASTINGRDINYLGRATMLAQLNDGRGVRVGGTGPDFQIVAGDGTAVEIHLGAAKTVGEVLDLINTVGEGKVRAEVPAGGNGIRLVDISGGGGGITVAALDYSKAAADLGIEGSGGAMVDGRRLIPNLNGVLIASLRGGAGLNLGQVSITDRSGATATVNFAGATTVRQMLNRINNAGIGVAASLNASQNGIQIADTSGGSGDIIISDIDSTTAEELGIASAYDSTRASVAGANLQRQWLTENTQLRDLNGGRGISAGRFRVTNSEGASATIDLSQADQMSVGRLIEDINSRNIGVVASVNANGDGILLTDTLGGALDMKVDDLDGSAAADLQIAGTAIGGAIVGSYEKAIEITATDTLTSVQQKINELGFGLSATIINDGSGLAPHRLSLTARNSGVAGRVVFDAGATSLQARTLIEAQDAAVFVGGAGAEHPLLITSSRNQLTNVVRGVTIDLHGVSDRPVTLNVSHSIENVAEQLGRFAEGFNEAMDKIAELTRYDTATNKRGLLMGDTTIEQVRSQLYAAMGGVVEGAGRYRILAEIGLRIGDGARLSFDEEKFRAAHAEDPQAVERLFAMAEKGFGTLIESRVNRLIDPVDGVLTRGDQILDTRTQQFEDRIRSMDRLLESKRARLERQFAQLESVLANLQAQQQSISQIQFIQPVTRRES